MAFKKYHHKNCMFTKIYLILITIKPLSTLNNLFLYYFLSMKTHELQQFVLSFNIFSALFQVVWLLQCLTFLSLIVFNILMFSHFNHALQLSSTTIQVSVINTASNFLATVSYCMLLLNFL